ncbi:redox-sensing transcriptional repressor Rex [Clostridium sp. MCC353]|uniref:redox-sensing transcriptional repressor Rex n=1 Tax=Clostridium sp. MCC353 TaxID=2592646 RepID=UPI001C020BF0|nr:redox-sensing transcriptional repressor Rex [Clostridium sp. MCC353]MBT9778130.1 redox-sensing transcriptional repressor Rex [Clostridium sp. MCC353]
MEDKKTMVAGISKKTLERLPGYYHYLQMKKEEEQVYISAPAIAADLNLNEVQVRKELALVSKRAGKPKAGFAVEELLTDIEDFLGYNNVNQAVLVGAGALGKALLSCRDFEQYGIEIVAAFDNDPEVVGTKVAGKMVLLSDKLVNMCARMNVHIGIITAPASCAQEICDRMVLGGVRAVWNFAPVHLNVPDHVMVQNEDMAASLGMLSKYLLEHEMPLGEMLDGEMASDESYVKKLPERGKLVNGEGKG